VAGKKLTFIDLFAGCGGLSEGFYNCGYKPLAHLEVDERACGTLSKQMIRHGFNDLETKSAVLQGDIKKTSTIIKLKKTINNRIANVIVGGPPCQSFSKLGRVRDPNSMKLDTRNFLYKEYVNILNFIKPEMFIFENVTGILTQKINGNKIFDHITQDLGRYYRLPTDPKAIILNSVHYGVPQERIRIFIIGVRKDLMLDPQEIYDGIKKTHYGRFEECDHNLEKFVSVEEAISDLPFLLAGEGHSPMPYDYKKPNKYLLKLNKSFQTFVFDHIARNHNELDVKRFRVMAKNRWNFLQLLENRPDLAHKKRRVFFNSYKVQWWENPSKTIISHLYKDGNQFIHPDYQQARSLTVREAARLQSFPDDFEFCGPRTEQFKQIGNAVPPLMALSIASSIKKNLEKFV
jgi:DNA (cytosine-5)-methyltransferase 1